MSEMCTAHQWI